MKTLLAAFTFLIVWFRSAGATIVTSNGHVEGGPVTTLSPWCRFCPARTTCPALREVAVREVAEVVGEPDTLTPERLSELLEAAEVSQAALLSLVKRVSDAKGGPLMIEFFSS
jgi:Protein of unknown function (DUF2800)